VQLEACAYPSFLLLTALMAVCTLGEGCGFGRAFATVCFDFLFALRVLLVRCKLSTFAPLQAAGEALFIYFYCGPQQQTRFIKNNGVDVKLDLFPFITKITKT
jgi:hypothetical protein